MGNPYDFGSAVTEQDTRHSLLGKRKLLTSVHGDRTNLNPQANSSADYYKHNMPAIARNNVAQPPGSHNNPHHRQHQGKDQLQQPTKAFSQPTSHKQNNLPQNAVADLLPYCTAGPPLRQEQVIALSDIVGSLKELALFALDIAAGNAEYAEKLIGAVGKAAASDIVAFFADELEME